MIRLVWACLLTVLVIFLAGCAKAPERTLNATEAKSLSVDYTWWRAACYHQSHGPNGWHDPSPDWTASKQDAINRKEMHKRDNPSHEPKLEGKNSRP